MHNCLLYFCDVAIICEQYDKRKIFRIYDMKKSVKTIIVLADAHGVFRTRRVQR